MEYNILDDVFNLGEFSKGVRQDAGFASQVLGRTLDDKQDCILKTKYYCNLEITLNYPRTAAFKRMSSDMQIMLYKQLFNDMFESTNLSKQMQNVDIQFEYCKDGARHLHASVVLCFDAVYSKNGLIEMLAKAWLLQLPKLYSYYNASLLRTDWGRYRCASIVIQWRNIEDLDRIIQWDNYIKKDIKTQ